jgi:hypothetical protein
VLGVKGVGAGCMGVRCGLPSPISCVGAVYTGGRRLKSCLGAMAGRGKGCTPGVINALFSLLAPWLGGPGVHPKGYNDLFTSP